MATPFLTSYKRQSLALFALAALMLSGCEATLNNIRGSHFGQGVAPTSPTIGPRTLAIALKTSADGSALESQSIQKANELLTHQGPIEKQKITLIPLSEKGVQLAPQLSQALKRSGAIAIQIAPLSADQAVVAQAQAEGWDLDLQSQALVVEVERCKVANPNAWSIHPYYGVGALGCANRANLARMTADPRDIVRPQTLDGASAAVAAAAVNRYQRGEIRELIDINFDE